MVFCTQCGVEFSRNEHLERHMLSHDKRRPYQCKVCFIAFTRSDVLQRHLKIHDDKTPPLRRGRGSRTQSACIHCARAKVRCEVNVPCRRCVNKNLLCQRKTPQAKRTTDQHDQASRPTESNDGAVSPASSSSNTTVTRDSLQTDEDSLTEVTIRDSASQLGTAEVPSSITGGTQDSQGLLNTMDEGSYSQLPDYSLLDLDYQRFFPDDDFLHWSSSDQDLMIVDLPPFTTCSDNDFLVKNDMLYNTMPEITSSEKGCGQFSTSDDADIIQAQRFWTAFCCTQSPDFSTCPKTATTLLRNLLNVPLEHHTIEACRNSVNASCFNVLNISSFLLTCVGQQLDSLMRSAVTKALKLHQSSFGDAVPHPDLSWGVEPKLKLIEHLLSHCHSLLGSHDLPPLESQIARWDMHEAQSTNWNALLLLSMLGVGSTCCTCESGRCLDGGLTEICRIALYDTLETDIARSASPQLIYCALLLIMQGSWSGEKWLTDIAIGQRGIYSAAFRHAGLFDLKRNTRVENVGTTTDLVGSFETELENQITLIYAWILVEQEVCLFRDQACLISTNEINTSLPSNPASLHPSMGNVETRFTPMPNVSLAELFEMFQSQDKIWDIVPQTPSVMRLLLLPIQELVTNHCRISNLHNRRLPKNNHNYAPRDIQLRETLLVLQKWFDTSQQLLKTLTELEQQSMRTTLILYHCIALNVACSIPKIETVTRKELPNRIILSNTQLAAQCVQDPERATWHASEILRCLKLIPTYEQPLWWPAAVYRASLTLWACSLFGTSLQHAHSGIDIGGTLLSLKDDIEVLEACLTLMRTARSTRFARGMIRRVQEFTDRRRYLLDS